MLTGYSFPFRICYFSYTLEQISVFQIIEKFTFISEVVRIFINEICGNTGTRFGSATRLTTFFLYLDPG